MEKIEALLDEIYTPRTISMWEIEAALDVGEQKKALDNNMCYFIKHRKLFLDTARTEELLHLLILVSKNKEYLMFKGLWYDKIKDEIKRRMLHYNY